MPNSASPLVVHIDIYPIIYTGHRIDRTNFLHGANFCSRNTHKITTKTVDTRFKILDPITPKIAKVYICLSASRIYWIRRIRVTVLLHLFTGGIWGSILMAKRFNSKADNAVPYWSPPVLFAVHPRTNQDLPLITQRLMQLGLKSSEGGACRRATFCFDRAVLVYF